MAKVVRWLGAFGKGKTLHEAVAFELRHEREVAAEPLFRGATHLHAGIGLVIDPGKSRFVAGWCTDAWTEVQADGTLRAAYAPRERQGRKYRCWDRFSAAFHAAHRCWHGEVVFDFPCYVAVAVRVGVSSGTIATATALAHDLRLPLEVIPMAE